MPAISILLVEDVVQLAQIVQELLEAEGYAVVPVHTYETALAALHERRFDLLIADVNLGTASGIDLVRRSREIDLGIKSVLTSGYPIASALKSDPALRCTGFLNKPFTRAELYECLKGTIDSDCV